LRGPPIKSKLMQLKTMIKFILCVILAISAQQSSCFAAIQPYPQTSKEWATYLSGPQTEHCPIIFVHGIAAGFEKWDPTAKLISDNHVYSMRYLSPDQVFHNYMGIRPEVWVWNVSYYTPDVLTESTAGNLTLYAQRLDQMIQTIARITGQKKVILVAHSMGGLVARKAITLRPENAQNIVAILTVGTPHAGVDSAIPIVGQFRDLATNSDFIRQLDRDWDALNKIHPIRWGVIGGIVTSNILPNITKSTTDLGGPGFVAIQSSIPFGEWRDATEQLGTPVTNTPHFAFRAVVVGQHNQLLTHQMTLSGIAWATGISKGEK